MSWLLLAKFVGRLVSFHRTTEAETKFEPNTVKVKVGPPAAVLVGEKPVIVGMGFMVIAQFKAFEVPPLGPGLKTVTVAVPVATMSLAEI